MNGFHVLDSRTGRVVFVPVRRPVRWHLVAALAANCALWAAIAAAVWFAR